MFDFEDDGSGCVRLVVCKAADPITTAEALIAYFADFGITVQWISDEGSHVKNSGMNSYKGNCIFNITSRLHTHLGPKELLRMSAGKS